MTNGLIAKIEGKWGYDRNPARKELDSLPGNVLTRFVRKIEALGHTPRPAYIIDEAAEVVGVTRIAHRSEVYQ